MPKIQTERNTKLCDKTTVESAWTTWDNHALACVQNVYNYIFMHLLKSLVASYAQFVLAVYTAVVNTFFMLSTSFNRALYTLSTQPIITIYLNKRVEE